LHADVLQLVVEDAFLTAPWTAALRVNDVVQDALLVLASEALQSAPPLRPSLQERQSRRVG
jgi:hypothetical protein